MNMTIDDSTDMGGEATDKSDLMVGVSYFCWCNVNWGNILHVDDYKLSLCAYCNTMCCFHSFGVYNEKLSKF
jgi:hypothetical protein